MPAGRSCSCSCGSAPCRGPFSARCSMQSARPYAATSMPDLRARAFEAGDADAWRRFVEQHPGASAYHTLPWRDVVSSVFGHAPRYLVAEAGGSLRGILPMFEVRMPLLGAK